MTSPVKAPPLCRKCRAARRKYDAVKSAEMYERRRGSGLCTRCGSSATHGGSMCTGCMAATRRRQIDSYRRRRTEPSTRICGACGGTGHNRRTCTSPLAGDPTEGT